MNVSDFKVLRKSYKIGDFSFTLGITRRIAIDGFSKYPEYFKLIQSKLAKEITNSEFDYEKCFEEHPEKITEILDLQEKSSRFSSQIVKYLLPTLLEKGGTILNGEVSYENYASQLITFCDENGILEDYFEEDLESEEGSILVQGFYSTIMSFINLGFTQGSSPSKPKIKITEI